MEGNATIYLIDEIGGLGNGNVAIPLEQCEIQGTDRAVVAITPPRFSSDGSGHVTVVTRGENGKLGVTDTKLRLG